VPVIKLTSLDQQLDPAKGALYRCLECGAYHTGEGVPLPPEGVLALVLAGRAVYDCLCSDACLGAVCKREGPYEPSDSGEDE
jgi:hypothetical protein